MERDNHNQPWEDGLTSFNRLSQKILLCPKPLYYSISEPDAYQEGREMIMHALNPGRWAICEILPLTKMAINAIQTIRIDEDELRTELKQLVDIFNKRNRSPHITGFVEALLDYPPADRHHIHSVKNLREEGVALLLVLETLDSGLPKVARVVNRIMGPPVDFPNDSSYLGLPPCAFQSMLFLVAEKVLRKLLRDSGQERNFDQVLIKGRLMFRSMQAAANRSIVIQQKYPWLVSSPWIQLADSYQTPHMHGTRAWSDQLDNAFDLLKAALDADQNRFQDSGFDPNQHAPRYFSRDVKLLLEAIGPKSDEGEIFDRQVIELAHRFIFWIYENVDENDVASLPSKSELKEGLPEASDDSNMPYRVGVRNLPRDRGVLYKVVGLSELRKGSGRKKGSKNPIKDMSEEN